MDPRPINELTSDNKVRLAILGVLVLLGLFLAVQIVSGINDFGRSENGTNSITVSGTGKASIAPDIAQISFTVQENASTVAAAQDSATKRTDQALAALKALGIDDKDVKTTGYQVYPQYTTRPCPAGAYCANNGSEISGYQVSQTVEVKVRKTDQAGDVLQKLGTLGVQNISGPNFMVDDDGRVQLEAREEAIKDAKERADTLAKQLGVRLGKVVSFSESGGAVPYFAYGKGGAMDMAVTNQAAPAPTLPTGENETTVTVTITYEIR
jgi:uncharacterized protein YggE